MSRVNKTKVLLGGAMNRKNPSKASCILNNLNILNNDVLDFGCGYGFDANYYKWDKFDPYYYDHYPNKKFKNIVCINVLNVVSKKIRKEIISNIQDLLIDDGIAYLCVPRNIPLKGKYSGFERRPQNYVTLTLKSIYTDKAIEIYELLKNSIYEDKTFNIGEN